MAMFEFKDSKNIQIDNCETTSEKILIGESVDVVNVKNSRAGYAGSDKKLQAVSTWKRGSSFLGKLTWQLVVGIVFPVVAAVIVFILGYS
jgi:hypothetical protein